MKNSKDDPGYGVEVRPIMNVVPRDQVPLPQAIEVIYCPAKNQQNYTETLISFIMSTAGTKVQDTEKQEYQYSMPWVTPSGHEFTFYDTPDNERLLIKHSLVLTSSSSQTVLSLSSR